MSIEMDTESEPPSVVQSDVSAGCLTLKTELAANSSDKSEVNVDDTVDESTAEDSNCTIEDPTSIKFEIVGSVSQPVNIESKEKETLPAKEGTCVPATDMDSCNVQTDEPKIAISGDMPLPKQVGKKKTRSDSEFEEEEGDPVPVVDDDDSDDEYREDDDEDEEDEDEEFEESDASDSDSDYGSRKKSSSKKKAPPGSKGKFTPRGRTNRPVPMYSPMPMPFPMGFPIMAYPGVPQAILPQGVSQSAVHGPSQGISPPALPAAQAGMSPVGMNGMFPGSFIPILPRMPVPILPRPQNQPMTSPSSFRLPQRQLIANDPDLYGIRRSERSRAKPVRYVVCFALIETSFFR